MLSRLLSLERMHMPSMAIFFVVLSQYSFQMQMNDPLHLERFNHDFSVNLQVNTSFRDLCSQDFDYFVILDLEGKVEILEFPVVVIDARTANFVDAFHRWSCRISYPHARLNFFSSYFL